MDSTQKTLDELRSLKGDWERARGQVQQAIAHLKEMEAQRDESWKTYFTRGIVQDALRQRLVPRIMDCLQKTIEASVEDVVSAIEADSVLRQRMMDEWGSEGRTDEEAVSLCWRFLPCLPSCKDTLFVAALKQVAVGLPDTEVQEGGDRAGGQVQSQDERQDGGQDNASSQALEEHAALNEGDTLMDDTSSRSTFLQSAERTPARSKSPGSENTTRRSTRVRKKTRPHE